MLSKEVLEQVTKSSQRPNLFERGTGNIWTEAYLADQMLQNHLNLDSDASSRRKEMMDRTIDFINTHIKKGSTILDLGCGPGLYAERLCMGGHKVTGIDFSKNSINYARESAQRRGLDIEYVYNNIFNVEYKEEFDLVIQIYGELNTFSDEERSKLFVIIQRALKPGGLFIFDVTTPAHRSRKRFNKDWYISNGGFWRGSSHIVLEEIFDYENDIWLEQYTVIDENEVKAYRNWFHDYTKEAIEEIILEEGFSQVQVIENLYEEEKEEEGEWLTVIAQK